MGFTGYCGFKAMDQGRPLEGARANCDFLLTALKLIFSEGKPLTGFIHCGQQKDTIRSSPFQEPPLVHGLKV